MNKAHLSSKMECEDAEKKPGGWLIAKLSTDVQYLHFN